MEAGRGRRAGGGRGACRRLSRAALGQGRLPAAAPTGDPERQAREAGAGSQERAAGRPCGSGRGSWRAGAGWARRGAPRPPRSGFLLLLSAPPSGQRSTLNRGPSTWRGRGAARTRSAAVTHPVTHPADRCSGTTPAPSPSLAPEGSLGPGGIPCSAAARGTAAASRPCPGPRRAPAGCVSVLMVSGPRRCPRCTRLTPAPTVPRVRVP